MSEPKLLKGTYVDVMIEDAANPGTFIPFCGMTTRSFTRQTNTRDQFVRNCDDKESPPFRRVIPTGKQWDLSASGLYNRAQSTLISGAESVILNYRFVIDEPADDAVYKSYWEGRAMLSQVQVTGDDGADVTAQLTFLSDGEWLEHVLP